MVAHEARIAELESASPSRSASKEMSAEDLERLRKGLEAKIRAELEGEIEHWKAKAQQHEAESNSFKKDQLKNDGKTKERVAELEQLVEKKDAEIRRLRAEVERLETAMQELQLQLQELLKGKGNAKDFEKSKKRIGETLNWVIKT